MTDSLGLRVSIHQPAYLPYGGFFAKLLSSDVHIVLDTVLYSRSGLQNRNRILTVDGPLWLTVPVHGRHTCRLSDVRVDQQKPWSKRHWRTLVTAYGSARTTHLSWVRALDQHVFLADVAVTSLQRLLEVLGRPMPILRASDLLPLEAPGLDANERLIQLVRLVGGKTYVSGSGGLNYMDEDRWRASGLSVQICQWHSPEYEQGPGQKPFVRDLSIVDVLVHIGVKRTLELLASGVQVRFWTA